MSGLIKVYREIKAFAKHAKLYDRMHLALQLTLPRLDAAIKDGNIDLDIDLSRELGTGRKWRLAVNASGAT